MGTDFMWCNKLIYLALCVVPMASAIAAPVKCPSSINDAGIKHVLNNASLYDGPPDQMADLIPIPVGAVDQWTLDGVDPYLVCKFQNTTKVVTFHVTAANVCETGKKPFQVYCK